MTAQTIANHLLEAEPEDIDPGAELNRLTTSQHPGYEIEMEGNHWNVYKQWRGSQHFIGEIYYTDMTDAPVEVMSPEALQFHDTHRWMSIAGFRDNEAQQCKTFDEAIQWIIAVNTVKTALPLGRRVAEAVDPDDPELYTHPDKFKEQPSYEKIESALRVMLAPYYTRISVNRRPGMFNTAGSLTRMSKPTTERFQNSFVWTIHCNRDTPLPLSIANRNLPGYNLDWRQEVKHWFQKWASRHNLSLLKFEIYGRLRKDPTFQFETISFGPLKEALDPYAEPENYLPHYMDRQREVLEQKLMEDLWKWHPYGVGYNCVITPRVAMVIAQTYFPPEKDNFATRFRDFVLDWFTKNKVMAVHFSKLTAGGGLEKDYPRWSVFLAVNTEWPPDQPAYVPPTVEPGGGRSSIS